MKLAVSADTVKSALSAHAAIGLIGAALLYLLCLSGTVLVLYEEWQRFEQQDAPEMQSISPAAVQRGIVQVIETEADRTPTTHLYVHMPTEELPRTTVTTDHQAFHLTPDGSIAVPEENAWSEFLYALHYAFNLPVLVGITIVGALGALMIALAITGVIALPRIFRDAFRLRAKQNSGISLADWHNRLSVWTLPFTLAIAITGAVIGLATVTAYAMAQGEYGGDVEAVYAPLFGGEDPADLTPAPLPDVAAAMDHMAAEYPGVEVTYAILHDPGTAGQHVQMVGAHGQRGAQLVLHLGGSDGGHHHFFGEAFFATAPSRGPAASPTARSASRPPPRSTASTSAISAGCRSRSPISSSGSPSLW